MAEQDGCRCGHDAIAHDLYGEDVRLCCVVTGCPCVVYHPVPRLEPPSPLVQKQLTDARRVLEMRLPEGDGFVVGVAAMRYLLAALDAQEGKPSPSGGAP